jgi:2-hydroxycyclohexanecarboxyl-CoA dehydrogenase
MFELIGKVAIVTGGARGIGKGICFRLAQQGARVVLADILADEGIKTEQEVNDAYKGKATFIKCDLTKKAEVDAIVRKIKDTFSKIDILVNNAGWDTIQLFSKQDPALWDRLIDLNLKHFLYTTKAVIPHMTEVKYGRIVNIASDAGRVGSTGEAVYSACKGGVIAFTKTMARELARFNVTVNCICPGPTKTPLVEEEMKDEFATKILGSIDRTIPLGRWGEPRDIGNAVAFFASDEAEFITGQTLSVSGGLTMT